MEFNKTTSTKLICNIDTQCLVKTWHLDQEGFKKNRKRTYRKKRRKKGKKKMEEARKSKRRTKIPKEVAKTKMKALQLQLCLPSLCFLQVSKFNSLLLKMKVVVDTVEEFSNLSNSNTET